MKKLYSTILFLCFVISMYAQQSPLTISVNHNLDDNSGGVFDVEVRVANFVDLYSVQLFLKWDPDLYRVDGVPYVNEDLPFFDDSSIILPAEDISIPDKGKVRIVWSNATTLSLDDDTHIVTLRFTAIGNPCDQSKFTFEDIGPDESEKILAADINFENIGIEYEDMNVQIPGVGCVSSIENLKEEIEVSVYPNPVSSTIKIEVQDASLRDTKFILFTQDGKVIKESVLDQAINSIDISELENGSYLYSIIATDKLTKRGQLLKIN